MTRSEHRLARRRFFRPLVERLEDRRLLATITVTGTGDTIAVDGLVTLREAIASANNNANVNADVVTQEPYETVATDFIHFNIPGSGVHTISPTSALPNITGPVTIDGYTQPGAGVNTNSVESMLELNAVLRIELDGTSAGDGVNGLTVAQSSGSTFRGLVVNRFSGNGIFLARSTNTVIEGNFIGTDASGTVDLGNTGSGVFLAGDDFGEAINNRLGGTTPAARNLISGNNANGVLIVRASSNVVEGNLIGTDASGTVDLGNNGSGVHVDFGVTSNRVGGTTPAARNIISGNNGDGIFLGSLSFFNQALGNYIGTDITGTQDLGNGGSGVGANSQNFNNNGNVIGGTAAEARNIISGNGSFGVNLNFMSNSVIRGNYIGTDVTGTLAIGNVNGGIGLFGAGGTTIGGDDDDDGILDGIVRARNLISGNGGEGGISGSASGTVVLGNFIGTQADGISPLGNGAPAPFNRPGINAFGISGVIGGTAPGAGNVIAFSTGDGIAGSGNLQILGNSIFGNGFRGVNVFGSAVTILGNSIFANVGVPGLAGLGIDLGGNGVTVNDTGDADTGANNLQNFPVLIEVLSTAGDSTIIGTLNSLAQTDFLIQFFASDAADPSGHGEGQTFLGETIVHTISAGNVRFSADVPVLLTPGQQVTATATRLFDHDANPSTPSVPTDTSEFSQAISGAASILELGQTIERDLPLNNEFHFRLNVPPGTDARLTAHFTNPQIGEILVRVGDLPFVNDFAHRVVAFVNPDPEFVLAGLPVPYFITVRGTSTANVALGHFSLTAEALGMEIDRITPNHGSNAGQVTTTIVGTRLTSDTIFSLIAPGGGERPATGVVQQSDTTFFVTFDLVGLAEGFYDIKAADGPNTAIAADAFTVTTGNPGLLETRLVAPREGRRGRESSLFVEYANLGETDIPSPLLIVESTNSFLRASLISSGFSLEEPSPGRDQVVQFLAISQTGPAGVLPPGARERVEIRFIDDGSLSPEFHEELFFQLIVAGPDETAFDLASAQDALRPPDVSPAAWEVVFSNLGARFGTTVGGYVQALREAATYLSRYGIYTHDVGRLLSLHFAQADNGLPGASPYSVIDAAAPASGPPLGWGRMFASTISRRFDLGILGRGWSHPWDISLSRDPGTSDVLIRLPDGARRFLDQPDGSFIAAPPDAAGLTLQSGVFSLRETNGTVSRFDEVTGRLLDVTDRNGHKVTLNYTAGLLTSLVHSNGDRFDFGYNGAGRLIQLTDQAGRVTTFAYDGQHLMSVTGPDGTIAYTYETTAGSPAEHALTSVTRADGTPDATHVFYEYDAQGRLGRTSRDGNAEAVTFAYGSAGEVFVTDALNNTTSRFFNDAGQLQETRDALGRSTRFDFDLARRLDRLTQPLDTTSLYDFCDCGNLTFVVKPDGGSQSFTYGTALNLLLTVRDERNVPVRYTYDAQGNLTSIIRADGSVEQFTPDADGNLTQFINRRGQGIDYTYDDRGLLIRKDHADASHEDFTYDDRGNLLTASNAQGTTTYTYDLADRLSSVLYPSGRSLDYTYDAAGRRIQMVDQDGFEVNHTYDAAGRLASLTDNTGATIVGYAYDAVGRISREDKGNGTFTTYEYDDAGQLVRLVNHAEDGSANSQFEYTYNELGLRTSVTALDGVTTYGYNAVGQLTSVALPGGRIIEYAYDAVGNRVSVSDDGIVTNYTANDLQEYLAVGSAARVYDADGNLISQSVGGQTSTYAYDDENRLVTVVMPAGTWTYEYDSLGNRIAAIENGQRTDYLLDPTGLVNVAGEYDDAGNLVARYVHSDFGLVSRFDVSGAASFYDFDSPGSTVALTAADGSILNRYSYLPFGETLTATESVANPFTYIGGLGVMAEDNGLSFMRHRFYQADVGAFTSIDPLRLPGDDVYGYALNNPITFVDPLGLQAGEFGLGVCKDDQGDPVPGCDPNNPPKPPAPKLDPGCAGGLGIMIILGAPPTKNGELIDPCKPPPPPPPNPPGPPGTPGGGGSTIQFGSKDPNDIVGPAGFGPDQFLPADSSLFYTIRFENLAAATAPAQEVVVTQTLDSDLDLATFELLSFGIGPGVVNLPAGRSSFQLRFDLRPEQNLLLDVGGDLNFQTGVITWTFTSLDPATLELPNDPQGGFLPPNQNPPAGEGFVTYIVRPKPGLPTGTRIDAKASIVFDVNAPIDTPAIFHTFDDGLPTSSVAPLPAVINSESFALQWSGSDDANGSGIATFDVFVSVDGGSFTPLLLGTTETSTTFSGDFGHTYQFFSVATDNVGHRQPTPAGGQAVTQLTASDPETPEFDLSQTNRAVLVDDPVNPGQHVLLVVGSDANETLSVERRPNNTVRVKRNGKPLGTFNNSGFERIAAFGLGGKDTLLIDSNIKKPVELHGGSGNDALHGGSGADALFGEDGNDSLFGRSGNDLLLGGDGNDSLYGGRGSDSLHGELGADKLYGEDGSDLMLGGLGDDKLYGGQGRDVLIGGLGSDRLEGQGDEDLLLGDSTTHDNDAAALLAILAEWNSRRARESRIQNLTGGTLTADRLNESYFLQVGTTIVDDNSRDQIQGLNARGHRDWRLP